jgi:hypothetical protein
MFGWEGKNEEQSVKPRGSQKRLKQINADSEEEDEE